MDKDTREQDTDVSDEESMDWLDAVAKNSTGINSRDGNGRTALIRAVMRNDVSAVRSLLAHGADPSLKDRNYKTALAYALETGNKALTALLQNTEPGSATESSHRKYRTP